MGIASTPFDGQTIQPQQTPRELGMDDGDCIDVMVEAIFCTPDILPNQEVQPRWIDLLMTQKVNLTEEHMRATGGDRLSLGELEQMVGHRWWARARTSSPL